MTRPLKMIYDSITGEAITREFDDEEFDEYQAEQADAADRAAEAEARATQKAALLDRLGITEDEAKLLLA